MKVILSNGAVMDPADFGLTDFSPEQLEAIRKLEQRTKTGASGLTKQPPAMPKEEEKKLLDQLEIQSARPGSIPGRIGAAVMAAAPAQKSLAGDEVDAFLAEPPPRARPTTSQKASGDEVDAFLQDDAGATPSLPSKALDVAMDAARMVPGVPAEIAATPEAQTAAVNALHAASLVGLPNALGAQDAIRHAPGDSFAGKLRDVLSAAQPAAAEVIGRRAGEVPLREGFLRARDTYKRKLEGVNAESPKSAFAGQIGAGLLTANPENIGQLALLGAAQQGLQSDELAAGDLPGAVKEAAKGGAVAGGAGLAGEGIGAGVSRLARGGPVAKLIGSRLAAARLDQNAAIAKAAQEELRSGISALGGESSTLLRLLDRAEEMLTNPAATEEQKAAAAKWLASPEGAAAKQSAYANVLEQLPGASGRVSTARAALEPLRVAATPGAVEAATEEAMQSPVTKQIFPRVTKYAQRAIPAIVAQKLGGGAPGVAAGALVGATMGSPSTAIGNMMRNPSVRTLGLNSARSLVSTGPALAAEALQPLSRAYLRMPDTERDFADRLAELLPGKADDAPPQAPPDLTDPRVARAIAQAAALRRR